MVDNIGKKIQYISGGLSAVIYGHKDLRNKNLIAQAVSLKSVNYSGLRDKTLIQS